MTNDKYYGVAGVAHLFKESEKGLAKIKPFEFKESENRITNFRAVRDGGSMFYIRDGIYVKLFVENKLMMSDTGMERISNKTFIEKAKGNVLIAGLGIGLIIHNILSNPDVTNILIIEKYQDVIDLVSPHFNDNRLQYICADIFDWKPSKGTKFDTIYFDIWPEVSTDNLSEITILHNKFKSFKSEGGYMDSWMKGYLQKEKRKRY